MKKVILLVVVLVASFIGLLTYSYTAKINEQIAVIRITESCVDIFNELNARVENVEVFKTELSKPEALESELEKFRKSGSNELALKMVGETVERHYNRGKSMLRITAYSLPTSFCSYSGYTINDMRIENVQIGLKNYKSYDMYKLTLLNSIVIENNNTQLAITDPTTIDRIRYLFKVIY